MLHTHSCRPKLVVKRSGDGYHVEDKDDDITVKVRVKRLNIIPTLLGE